MSGHHTMCSCLCPLSAAFPHPEALVTSFSLFTHLSSHTLINPTNINWGLGLPSGSVVKNPPVMQETWVGSLGWERSPGVGHGNPLQFLPGKSHGQRSLVGNSPRSCKRIGHDLLNKNNKKSVLAQMIKKWGKPNLFCLHRTRVLGWGGEMVANWTTTQTKVKLQGEFSGGSGAKTRRFQCREPGFNPWSGN